MSGLIQPANVVIAGESKVKISLELHIHVTTSSDSVRAEVKSVKSHTEDVEFVVPTFENSPARVELGLEVK